MSDTNKRIAELRGEPCWNHMENGNPNWNFCSTTCEECNNPENKPYSTDIACAMELWEEMIYEFAEIELTWIRADEQYLIRPFLTDEDADSMNYVFEIRESTQAKVICEAWIKWKEGA